MLGVVLLTGRYGDLGVSWGIQVLLVSSRSGGKLLILTLVLVGVVSLQEDVYYTFLTITDARESWCMDFVTVQCILLLGGYVHHVS